MKSSYMTYNTSLNGYVDLLVEKICNKNEGNGDIFMLTVGTKAWNSAGDYHQHRDSC